MNQVIGVEINIPGIAVAVVDVDEKSLVPNTYVYESVNTHETAEKLISSWATAIKKCAELNHINIDKIGLAIPGPFDYASGVSLMKNQGKFDSLYNLNLKELLAQSLGIEPCKIRTQNNTPCFLHGEVHRGSAQGYKNVLGFTLNLGLGTARYYNGKTIDADLWNKPFKDGIAEDYVGIQYISKRYKEFTGQMITDIKELTHIAETDDGIGQLVFNEYGENFVKFLMQYVALFQPDAILVGGHSSAWDLFIQHVKDRLSDKNIKLPIIQASLGNDAALIGAADLWKDNL